MDMQKEALEFINHLKDNKIYEIGDRTYSENELIEITPPRYYALERQVNSLNSIVSLLSNEIHHHKNLPVFVEVNSARSVTVYTSYDDHMNRSNIYKAVCDTPQFREGFREREQAIIELRSKFIETDDLKYVLELLSRISKDNGISTEDNGVTQTVEARQGISLKSKVAVRPRVSLRPYRTFLEVEQPESEFLLRLNDDGDVGLFEADGGMWTVAAKKSIHDYLESALKPLVDDGKVVVMM